MKKISITICLLLVFSGLTFSQGKTVSKENARTVAEKFFYERIQTHRNLPANRVKTLQSFEIYAGKQIVYYVFNFSPEGFVAVSAYDGVTPVLFYSFSGYYKTEDQPDNFKAWVEQYQMQISNAKSTNAEGIPDVAHLWEYYLNTPIAEIQPFTGREVLPMLTSTWDQGTYYNSMCPADPAGPSGHCVTGCVATALGQLMNYFRWPESGTGSYSYDCPPYGTLSVDFSAVNYQWDLMEDNLTRSNPEVAELIYDIGVSVDMVYGPDGSGMYNHKGAYTLKTYFKYSPETQYVFRDSTSMDWDSLIVNHLDRKIPMYYAGWSVPDTNGHAFICDGYQGEGYYHFNWGWSGSYDGYFYTDNLTPGGNNFNLAQELIINAVPDTVLYTYPVQCQGDKEFTVLNGTLDDGSGPLYNYENGADCSWLITPNDSVNSIVLSFHRFDLADSDYLTVYDGTDTTADVLGSFSGSEPPTDVTTTGGSMFIRFNSNVNTIGDGFLASFESETPVYCSGMTQMNAQTDTLSDGSGSWNYHDNTACLWRIMPPGASSVTLYFINFETEAGFDLLKIYDLQTQELLAEYSGTYPTGVPDPVTSPSGKMFITFNSNAENNAPGWTAYYETNIVGIDEPGLVNDLMIFPNPTSGKLTIQAKNNNQAHLKLSVTDISGRQVISSEMNAEQNEPFVLDMQNITPGIYLLRAEYKDGQVEFHRIIRN